jgi:predicted  nucleic acid-binding Zn-ribbon protein
MEDLDFIIQSKDKIKSLQGENETLKNNLLEANREIDRLKHKLKEVNDFLASSKQEVVQLNNKISGLIDKANNEIDKANNIIEEKNQLLQKIQDIVYNEKYDEWARSSWRLMERTDFEEFLKELRAVFEE